MSDDEETAEDHLRSQIAMAKDTGTKLPSDINGLIARNVLHEELGYFPKSRIRQYRLDEATRDRLLVHGRQDAAHALLNSITILEEISRLKRLLWIALALIAVVFLYLFVGGR